MTYLEENETQAVLNAVDGTARTGVRDQACCYCSTTRGHARARL